MSSGDSDNHSGGDRRVAKRRSDMDRRFGERRRPERAVAGRRVLFMDRRVAERRVAQELVFQTV